MKLKCGLTAIALLAVMNSQAVAEAELTDDGYQAVMDMLNSGEWSVRTKWPLLNSRDGANRVGEVEFIPITVHVVRTDVGTGGVDLSLVDAAIEVANSKFNDTAAGNFGYTFYRESVIFLDDDDYAWFHMDDGELGTLIQQNPVPGTVNAYFVPNFQSLDPIAGVSTLPYGGVGGMAISNTGTGALTHEMGHYFGLFHPFTWDAFGDECASGDGCQYSGDLICETPADPGTDWWGNFRAAGARAAGYCYRCEVDYQHQWDPGANDGLGEMTDDNCIFADVDCDDIGPDCHTPIDWCEDPNQCHEYRPLTQNIMSYYGIDESFVSEQLSLMRANLQFMLADHVRSDKDCNGNDLPDSFEIESLWYSTQDCDNNGRPDDCDIMDTPALDCDLDGLIDHCETAAGAESDCNENGVIDRCDITNDPLSNDCNGNGELDLCELQDGDESDCDGNGRPDTCDMDNNPAADCNSNGLFDNCEILSGAAIDCDSNGVIDECELPGLPEKDCNGNGIFDDCEVVNGGATDCDSDGMLDQCQLDLDADLDCNGDGVLDTCNIADGTASDCDASGIPDSCEELLVRVSNALADPSLPYQAHFAESVSLDGTSAVFGIPGDNGMATNAGAASVYRRNSASGWDLEYTLRLAGGSYYDEMGSSVAISRDVVAAGVPGDDDNGSGAGSVAVFRDTDGAWAQETKLFGSDTGAGDDFGSALAMDGSVLVVGAPSAEGNESAGATGAVYIFEDGDVSWEQVERLVVADGMNGDLFGAAVAIDGSNLLIGAPNAATAGAHSGGTYAFRHDGEAWVSDGVLSDSVPAMFNSFGTSVSVNDNWAIVGAPGADISGINGAGAADIFQRTASGWEHQYRVIASDPSANDGFGSQVAIDGPLALVTAPYHDGRGSSSLPNSGAAYVFVRHGDVWVEGGLVGPNSPTVGSKFGSSLAVAGALSIIGAPYADGALNDVGAAYEAIQLDCDQDGQVDTCQIDSGEGDCDGDGIVDTCAIAMEIVDDCNFNGVPDACDLLNTPGLDADGNGIIDACEGPSGFPGGEDGFGLVDLMIVINNWGSSNTDADYNGDGTVGILDLIYVLQGWRGD